MQRIALALWMVLGLDGCSDDAPVQTTPVAAPVRAPVAPPAPVATAVPTPATPAEPASPPRPVWELHDTDFVEVEGQRRDPFRSYAAMFASERGTHVGPQVPVLLAQYSIDDLRLMAIVGGAGAPRAMVIDPTGVGTIVRRGDYVGRGEVVRGGPDGSSEFEVNWRVQNIRMINADLVLVREDPTSTAGTPVTRVLPLHPGGTPGAPAPLGATNTSGTPGITGAAPPPSAPPAAPR